MQSELTPVQEVAFFIARGKVQDRIEKRKRELMDNLEACARKGKKKIQLLQLRQLRQQPWMSRPML